MAEVRAEPDPEPEPEPEPERAPAASKGASPRVPWRKRVASIAVEVGLVVAVYFAISAWQGRKLLGSDTKAPPFQLRALDGAVVDLESLRGKRVALHFWATWCGVCRQEHGALNAVAAGLGPDEALYAIVADSEDPDAIRRYVKEADIHYPVLLADAKVVRDYRVSAFPTNYFIDPKGNIRSVTVGMSTRFSMDARLGCAR